MDTTNHPILQEAVAKRDAALAEAKYWERFIDDYNRLSQNNHENAGRSTLHVLVQPQLQLKELTWPQMRKIGLDILKEKGIVENAAIFASEFSKRGYQVTKEKLSACFTHAKKHYGEMDYDKTKGGWYLIALQKTA